VKLLAAVLAALTLVSAARPVAARVLEVSASLSLTDAEDQAKLRSIVEAAVTDALRDAEGFVPTVAVLTRATVVGNRLHLRVLLADDEEMADGVRAMPAGI
jgi:hypothetical protein